MDSVRPIEAEDGFAVESEAARYAAGGPDRADELYALDEPHILDEPRMEPPPAIGTDERRMHVRAYNYWVSLLAGRAYPSIEDIDPDGIDDFGAHSVLLDFTEGPSNPAIPFLGKALRHEGGLPADIAMVADVPSGSLISRLTDHYLEIIANRAPIGFEAEFVNRRGCTTLYRGILMPFSSDDDTIDFLYGVINWKELAEPAEAVALVAEVAQALRVAPSPAATAPVWADGPNAKAAAEPEVLPETAHAAPLFGDIAGDAPVERRAGAPSGEDAPVHVLPEAQYSPACEAPVELDDCLAAARECVEIVRRADGRGRAALYRALGLAYDFALLAGARPDDYAALLADAGLKAQARAPMTPLVKLVFGADYDKTRLAEFGAALAYATRVDLPLGGLRALIERHPGGLKAIVAAERAARRPAARPDRAAAARDRLRAATPLHAFAIGPVSQEFVLLMGRRESDGRVAVVGRIEHAGLVERAMRVLPVA